MSSNEELARMNAELESAKRQLESTTAALSALNADLQLRHREVARINAGLVQLVAAAQQAQTEAERASGSKDDFLATLSHELRTPLASMLLHAQRLRGGDLLERTEVQRAGEALERATWLQAKLIDDLLDVWRMAAGRLTLDRRAVDLCSIAQTALDQVQRSCEDKSLTVHVALDRTIGSIWADSARVQQVLSNLLMNAVKFTPRAGVLTITVDADARYARVRVTDTGIGIDATFLPHVFARFTQSDSSLTREYGGLGLGLALVRQLVELHGGNVLAESAGADCGASFSVTLPLTRASNKPVLPPLSPQPLDRPGRSQHYDALVGLRVLFIDDDLGTREAVLEVLQLTGAKVQLAASAAEAMSVIDSFEPQVILCDIAMPGEDGYTFVRKLRARDARLGTAIPALALTAMAAEEDRRRALAAGFQLHLAKPIDIDRLREAVFELSKLIQTPE
jgi:signal transduction histidine kinase/ActR/RegA family two-component response regulator